ncbi:methyltransferase domain-containing protein [Vibrio sp. RE86]|uniref:class I SAM-dependent methyltransferase n=1 Tax=Vibrio sp. RE86 TaxID=2607605 RepID=UPI0014939AAE|nr:methyltransferase domain-containing protein [Vibrio sp. RE86]NOH78164.1 methyltransferase domain-containing protein [Vibrio sp. RE86]
MKVRDSGMPQEQYWASFFNVELALDTLLPVQDRNGDWIEVGCGYGTFSLPFAQHIQGKLSSFDIEPEMVERVSTLAKQQALTNLVTIDRDVIQFGTGKDDQSHSGVMIYNLLHLENPVALLKEAYRNLKVGGCLSVIHWRSDIDTPRGPSLDIRPTPEQTIQWMEQAGFQNITIVDIEQSCPYHYGVLAWR